MYMYCDYTFRQDNNSSLQAACQDVSELFVFCKITPSVEEQILQELLTLFGEDYHQVSLAVRSSAAGKCCYDDMFLDRWVLAHSHGGLMVDHQTELRGPGFNPHWRHHVVSLSKTLNSQEYWLYPGSGSSVRT